MDSIDASTIILRDKLGISPIDQAELNDLTEVVFRCLDDTQQMLLRMRLAGFTVDQIAAFLHVSTKTIQRRQHNIANIVQAIIPEIAPHTTHHTPHTTHHTPISFHERSIVKQITTTKPFLKATRNLTRKTAKLPRVLSV